MLQGPTQDQAIANSGKLFFQVHEFVDACQNVISEIQNFRVSCKLGPVKCLKNLRQLVQGRAEGLNTAHGVDRVRSKRTFRAFAQHRFDESVGFRNQIVHQRAGAAVCCEIRGGPMQQFAGQGRLKQGCHCDNSPILSGNGLELRHGLVHVCFVHSDKN